MLLQCLSCNVQRMFRLADANRDNKLSLREFLFALGHFPDDDDIEREKTKALSKRARKEYERCIGLCIKQYEHRGV